MDYRVMEVRMSMGRAEQSWKIQVGDGATTAIFEPAPESLAGSLLALAHSSGGGMDHPTMLKLSEEFRSRGIDIVRFNFLYKERGSGPPDRMPRLTDCFSAVVERIRSEINPSLLFLGGHSMGGRAASMMAADAFPCDGLILLGYPLHPAGQPEKLRTSHLTQIKVPVLCMNGTRDDLCRRDLMEAADLPSGWTMHWLEGADHGFHVQKRSGRTEADVIHEIGEVTQAWVTRLAG
jgi:uncharacterized protein